MMVSFPFFSEPILFDEKQFPVVCIENPAILRQTVMAFHNKSSDENAIVFSQNYEPFSFSKYGVFVSDYWQYVLPSAQTKKLYCKISDFCMTDMDEETTLLKKTIVSFLEQLNYHYDFDFNYDDNLEIPELLKAVHFMPDFHQNGSLENLLDYILLVHQLEPVRCFILLHLHQYFSEEDLSAFFEELMTRHIPLLILEGSVNFQVSRFEKCYICDRDMCEIVDSDNDP